MARSIVLLFAFFSVSFLSAGDARSAEAETAESDRRVTPYHQGKVRFHLSGGYVGRAGDDIFTISGGFGVFVVDNLELGIDGAVWLGANPNQGQLGPQLRYILPVTDAVHPYFGAFYNRVFIGDGFTDQDSIGGRAGVLVRTSSVFLTIGLAYEAAVSGCPSSADCDEFYPEFGISLVL